MASRISEIWGKRNSTTIVTPQQQESMHRFLTPPRNDSVQQLVSNSKITISNDDSNKHLHNLVGKYRKPSMMKLPKIRSMKIDSNNRVLGKDYSGILNQNSINNTSDGMKIKKQKTNIKANNNGIIKEVTGENFFTHYDRGFGLGAAGENSIKRKA